MNDKQMESENEGKVTIEFSGGRLCGQRIQLAGTCPDEIELKTLHARMWQGKEPWIEGERTTELYLPETKKAGNEQVFRLFVRPNP